MEFVLHLRSKVRGCQDRLEVTEIIMDPYVTLDIYRGLLNKLYHLLKPIETQLFLVSGWQELGLDVSQRFRAPFIKEDLISLGGAIEGSVATRRYKIPQFYTLSHALGVLYVLEEASLSGPLIFKHLSEQLGITIEFGGRFLNVFGENQRKRWSEFCQILNSYANKSQKNQEDILNAACATYFVFEKYLK